MVYLVIWLLAMYLGQSIMGLSHSAWAAVLAKSYEQRSRIFGVLTAVGVIGSLTALAIPILLEQGGFKDINPIQAIGWFVIAMIPITLLIVVIPTPETVSKDDGGRFTLADYAKLFSRGNVLRILAADLFVTLGPGWMAALYMFFFTSTRGFSPTGASLLLMVYIVAGFVGAPLTAALANRISKHRALMLTTTLYSIGLTLLLVLPKGSFVAFVPAMAIEGALAAGFGVMIRAITADVGDELRLEGGREQIGLLYALTAATSKLAGAFLSSSPSTSWPWSATTPRRAPRIPPSRSWGWSWPSSSAPSSSSCSRAPASSATSWTPPPTPKSAGSWMSAMAIPRWPTTRLRCWKA